MKSSKELRNLGQEALEKRLEEFKKELFSLRSKSATGSLENSGKLKLLRRNIARAKTFLRENELKALIKKKEVESK